MLSGDHKTVGISEKAPLMLPGGKERVLIESMPRVCGGVSLATSLLSLDCGELGNRGELCVKLSGWFAAICMLVSSIEISLGEEVSRAAVLLNE